MLELFSAFCSYFILFRKEKHLYFLLLFSVYVCVCVLIDLKQAATHASRQEKKT